MTNFFGSVMETIHTDSAYGALSGKQLKSVEIKMSSDSSGEDRQRILENSDVKDQGSGLNIKVSNV